MNTMYEIKQVLSCCTTLPTEMKGLTSVQNTDVQGSFQPDSEVLCEDNSGFAEFINGVLQIEK